MNEIKFSELPDFIRVKLSEQGIEEFWHRIDEFGGIKAFSEGFDYPSSTVYNWKNKDSFMPIDPVRKVFGNEATDEIIAIKGKGRSRKIKNPEFPIKLGNELLTRIEQSVNVNSNGIPIYQTNDQGNVERFIELLNKLGDTPFELYSRSVYELRYPKFLHKIIADKDYKEDFGALIDEKGKIKGQKLIFEDREKSIKEFEGEIYSRRKRYEFYLQKGDSEKLGEIISEEASRVDSIIMD